MCSAAEWRGLTYVSVVWRLDCRRASGCWKTPRRFLQESKEEITKALVGRESSERLKGFLPSLFLLYFVQRKTCLWSKLGTGLRSYKVCNADEVAEQERKLVSLTKEEVGLVQSLHVGQAIKQVVRTRLALISCSANLSSLHNYKRNLTLKFFIILRIWL